MWSFFRFLHHDANEICSRGEYAQDIFTVKTAYFEGQPPKSVNMYWRRFALSSIPIDDPVAFEVWLRARWMEKDGLIEAYHRYGRFPADRGAHKTREGRIIRGAGHIEAEVKSDSWYEFLQIFAPVGLFALVLYMFYNALPKTYTDSLNRQNVIKQAEELQNTQISLQKQQLLTHSGSTASTGQDSLLAKAMTIYTDLSKSPVVRKVVQLPELSPKGLTNEFTKHQPAFDTILTQKNALRDLKTKLPASLAEMPPSMAPSRTNGQRTVNDSETNHVKTQPKQLATTASPRKQAKINAPNGFGTNDLQVHNPVFKPPESKKIESKKVSEITRQSTPRKEAQNKMPQQLAAQHKPVFSA
jgi:Acyltransferase C-terminus